MQLLTVMSVVYVTLGLGRLQEIPCPLQRTYTIPFECDEFDYGSVSSIDDVATVQQSSRGRNGTLPRNLLEIRRNTPEFGHSMSVSTQTNDACLVEVPVCDPSSKYRSIDGSCNNLENPSLGMAGTPFIRLLPAQYSDGIAAPRLAADGNDLPPARRLSVAFFRDVDNPDEEHSLATMQWGQIISHDVTISPSSASTNIDCCSNISDSADYRALCLPIVLQQDDPFFSRFNKTCQNMVRTQACQIGTAQQVNGVTHMIDGSFIYGSDLNSSRTLRDATGGRLAVQRDARGRSFLPNVQNATSSCFTEDDRDVCYRAGDSRVNQNTELTVLHTLFLREHNRIAADLEKLHPDWNDETLYQETRRIVIAELQHITYAEWLPKILGSSFVGKFGLLPKPEGFIQYKKNVPIGTINSFSAAAFRALHSGIRGKIQKFDRQHLPMDSINFSDWMNIPRIVQERDNFDGLLLGLVDQSLQRIDAYFSREITTRAFHYINPYGIDLESLDIQRGRDHGIPSYTDVVRMCSGFVVGDFLELRRFMNEKEIEGLRLNYKSVDDIDLFVGGILEQHLPGTKLGPTFTCLIGEQFYWYKFGDRFWYEVGNQPHSFTMDQLQEIRKVTLASLICSNGDKIIDVPRDGFARSSKTNPITSCKEIPNLNLTKWK